MGPLCGCLVLEMALVPWAMGTLGSDIIEGPPPI
jgi:hypothetical protein